MTAAAKQIIVGPAAAAVLAEVSDFSVFKKKCRVFLMEHIFNPNLKISRPGRGSAPPNVRARSSKGRDQKNEVTETSTTSRRHGVRSLLIYTELGVEPLLLCLREEVFQAYPTGARPFGHTRVKLEKLYLQYGLGVARGAGSAMGKSGRQ